MTILLLAYDGSPSSATAIAVAGRLFPSRKAVVCHAARRDDPALAAEGAERAREAGLEATPMTELGRHKSWRALLGAADSAGASAIVAGAHGHSGVRPAVLGSVSTALVHHSPIPVLVVPAATTEVATAGPLLVCYDGSEGAKRAIAAAAELFGERAALVFHAWESWGAAAPGLAGASGTVRGVAAELDQIADEQSESRTAEGVDAARRAGLRTEGVSKRATGPIWKTALDAADDHGCAAIVAGSRGLTGISAALGSVANGLVHHSRRPVLVVPPEEAR